MKVDYKKTWKKKTKKGVVTTRWPKAEDVKFLYDTFLWDNSDQYVTERRSVFLENSKSEIIGVTGWRKRGKKVLETYSWIREDYQKHSLIYILLSLFLARTADYESWNSSIRPDETKRVFNVMNRIANALQLKLTGKSSGVKFSLERFSDDKRTPAQLQDSIENFIRNHGWEER